MLHAHAAIWKERGHLTTQESPIKYGDQILRLLEAVHLPDDVSVSHCKGHQKGSTEVARRSAFWIFGPEARGILTPSQGSNPHFLHWK